MQRKEKHIIVTRKLNKKEKIPMYVVRSVALVNWLCQRGFTLLKAEDSKADPLYKVFMFEDSEPLRQCVADYLSIRKKV